MRKFVKIIVATCTIFFSVANANNGGGVRVKLLFENKEAVVVLSDNPTSNSLLEQLPLELIFVDYASQEKVSRGLKLSMKDAPPRYAPKVGEVIYFAPTG